jgi:hypothetical protein
MALMHCSIDKGRTMKPHYTYHTAQGNAVLNKGDDFPLVKIGKFKTEAQAIEACRKHYTKACKALENFNKPVPSVFFA